MLNLNIAQKQWVKDAKPINVSLSTQFLDGATITITGDDIVSGSFVVDRNCAYGKYLEIGNAESAELRFTLINNDRFKNRKFAGARVTTYYVINSVNVLAGEFTIDEEPRHLDMIDISALDRMARFDRPMPSVVYPIQTSTLLAQIASYCGVTLGADTVVNGDYVIEYSEKLDGATCHQMIGWIAGLCGTNALIDETGKLRFRYPVAPVDTIDLDYATSLSYSNEPITITGVEYSTEDTTFLAGTEGYTFDLTDNPLIREEGVSTVLNNVLSKWNGYTYQPIESATVTGLPHLFPMDSFSSPTFTHPILLTNHNYSVNAMSDIASAGTIEPVKGYASGVLSDRERTILASVANRVSDVVKAETMTGYTTAILELNKDITNALGFYSTEVEVDGKTRVYKHDQPTLAESQYIEYKPEAGTLVWTDTGWNGGEPVWQSGFTKTGSLVMRLISAVGINAEWINLEGQSYTSVVNGMVSALDTRVATNKTSIDNLGLRVTATESTNNTHTTKITNLEAGALTLSERVDNIRVGGTNLISLTNLEPNLEIETTKSFFLRSFASFLMGNAKVRRTFVEGETYTMSFDVELVEKSPYTFVRGRLVGLYLYSPDNPSEKNIRLLSDKVRNLGDTEHFELSFVCPEIRTNTRLLFYCNAFSPDSASAERAYDKIRYSNFKLEKGNKATDWSPSPDDVEGVLDAHEATLNAYDSTLSGYNTRITENFNSIDTLGNTIESRTTIDGVLINEKVATLSADYLELTSTVNNLRTGGGNMLKNPMFGTTDSPSGDWWYTGLTWGEAEFMGLTWGAVENANKTWANAENGEI